MGHSTEIIPERKRKLPLCLAMQVLGGVRAEESYATNLIDVLLFLYHTRQRMTLDFGES